MRVLLLAVCLASLLLPEPAVGQEQAYTQRVETWRQEREARLRSETGWLDHSRPALAPSRRQPGRQRCGQ